MCACDLDEIGHHDASRSNLCGRSMDNGRSSHRSRWWFVLEVFKGFEEQARVPSQVRRDWHQAIELGDLQQFRKQSIPVLGLRGIRV